jgi:hypothetical protein
MPLLHAYQGTVTIFTGGEPKWNKHGETAKSFYCILFLIKLCHGKASLKLKDALFLKLKKIKHLFIEGLTKMRFFILLFYISIWFIPCCDGHSTCSSEGSGERISTFCLSLSRETNQCCETECKNKYLISGECGNDEDLMIECFQACMRKISGKKVDSENE